MLANKTIIVTGSAGGLGEGIAQICHREGANVVLADLHGERVRQVAARFGDRALGVTCDVRNA